MDRAVVTCLDGAGRWRLARLRLVGSTSGDGVGKASDTGKVRDAGDSGDTGFEDQLTLDYLDERASTAPIDSGVVTGGFTDWHVHLHLIDWTALAGSPITRVHDLGGSSGELQRIAAHWVPGRPAGRLAGRVAGRVADPASGGAANHTVIQAQGGASHDGVGVGLIPPHHLEVLHAGAFLTPPGGYPSDRSWAPAGSFREVANEVDAERAVHEMVASGASAIKVASNSEAGPVFSDAVFTSIVSAARAAGLPVVAHAEGKGEAMRVARLGATRLAHAPFSELLTGDEIAELAASTTWCSTLDIHGWGDYGREHETAVANVSAFVSQGGHLLYGTDMGNGPTPVGLNSRELASLAAAGLTPEQQLMALTPGDPRSPNATLLWIPRNTHGRLDIAAARRLHPSDLVTLSA